MSDLDKALKNLREDKDLKQASKEFNSLVRLKRAGRLSAFGETQLRNSINKTMEKRNNKRKARLMTGEK